MVISEDKKNKGVFCCAYHCNNKPVKRLGGLCYKHYRRKRKELDPVGERYQQMKSKAKQRGKDFYITLSEFRKFCEDTGYILKKGFRGKAASVDRKINSKGYSIDNIELLTLRQNINKYFTQDRYEDCPF